MLCSRTPKKVVYFCFVKNPVSRGKSYAGIRKFAIRTMNLQEQLVVCQLKV